LEKFGCPIYALELKASFVDYYYSTAKIAHRSRFNIDLSREQHNAHEIARQKYHFEKKSGLVIRARYAAPVPGYVELQLRIVEGEKRLSPRYNT
jgi:hypothetical protein